MIGKKVFPPPTPPAIRPRRLEAPPPTTPPVALPAARTVSAMPISAAPSALATAMAGMSAPADINEGANPLPTFDNRYDEMKWRGGVDYGGRGGDPVEKERWETLTDSGKFNPQKVTGKDRFKEALMSGLTGALQGMAATGQWQGAVGGGAAGATGGAVAPGAMKELRFEPRRKQLMDQQQEMRQQQAEQLKIEGLRTGIDYDRARTEGERAEVPIRQAKSKSEIEARAAQVAMEAALNKAKITTEGAQAGSYEALTAQRTADGARTMALTGAEKERIMAEAAAARARGDSASAEALEKRALLPLKMADMQAGIAKTGAEISNLGATQQAKQLESGTYAKTVNADEVNAYLQAENAARAKSGRAAMTLREAQRVLKGKGYAIE